MEFKSIEELEAERMNEDSEERILITRQINTLNSVLKLDGVSKELKEKIKWKTK